MCSKAARELTLEHINTYWSICQQDLCLLLSYMLSLRYSRRTGAAWPWVGDRNLYKSSLVWEVKPVKPNVDYARFEVLVNQVEAEACQ